MSSLFSDASKKDVIVFGFAVGRKRVTGFATPLAAALAGVEAAQVADNRSTQLFRGKTPEQKIRMTFGPEYFERFFPNGVGQ